MIGKRLLFAPRSFIVFKKPKKPKKPKKLERPLE